MQIIDYLNGCLDAGDTKGAVGCILTHPISNTLKRPSVARLYDIAFGGQPHTRCDALFVEILGDAIRVREGQ